MVISFILPLWFCVCNALEFLEYYQKTNENVTGDIVVVEQGVSSVLQCASICSSKDNCTVIKYNDNNGTCVTITNHRQDAVLTTSIATSITYERMVSYVSHILLHSI